ncbi:DUF6932 family protein [Glutamicibacter sp.]|jgi:hypothetical protein|uniref:DUF6932 family protein n=1 Tax=Glutamicibacter sp. TaxID=1931995 RepID=UPI002B4A9292|nr:hypothetical protein [Glutamicibacter sp.]HJX78592.1 hypothetical protein [Glutamicibacter sp.]
MTEPSLLTLDSPLLLSPPGRSRLTFNDFENQYGPGTIYCGNDRRQQIWDHFVKATAMLRDSLPIAAVWIGGSFVTNKPEPNDIDAVYILNQNKYSTLDDFGKRRIAGFAEDGWLFDRGIRVDSHVVDWFPHSELDMEDPSQGPYLKSRGYWDDFLQRYAVDKLAELTEDSAIPKRGYLEVILDGYDS